MPELDSFDRQILHHLQADASIPVAELAERIALSKTACWRRIQKLEETGVVRQRVALLDAAKLDLGLTVFISIRTNQHNADWASRFQNTIELLDAILEVHRMSGDLDYLLKAVVKDMAGYDKLYKQLIQADLFDVSSSFSMETLKYSTQLPL